MFTNVMEIYKTVLSYYKFYYKDIKHAYFSSLEILIDFERFPNPGIQSLNLTQINNKRNNAIKAHLFHIHHILNELCVSWASMTRLSKPLNEFCLS